MQPLSKLLGALAICLSASLWGLDGVVLTPRLANLSVTQVVFLVHAIPFLLMQPFLFGCWSTLKKLPLRDWVVLTLVSLTGGILGTMSIVKAIFLVNFDHLSVVVLLQKLQPVFAILLAAILLSEYIGRRFATRAVAAILGAYLLTFGLDLPEISSEQPIVMAAFWAALAAASFGAATVFGKMLLSSLDFKQATFGRYALTSMISLAVLLSAGQGIGLDSVTPANWAILAIIALTTGSGAIFLYYFGLTHVRATVATICELCLPLSAILLDYFINDSRLGLWQWVGAGILITSIALVSLSGERKRPASGTPSTGTHPSLA